MPKTTAAEPSCFNLFTSRCSSALGCLGGLLVVSVPTLGHWGEAIWGQVGASRLPFTGWQPRRRAPDADVIHFGPALPRPHLRSTTRMLGGNRVTYGAELAEMACASSQSLHDIIGAHWRTFCRSSSGVIAERNWGTCGKTQLCVSDEWLGLLSLTCPPFLHYTSFSYSPTFLSRIQMQWFYFVVSCAVPSGVSITYQWGQWFALFSLFTSLLLFASPCPTKKKKRRHTCIFRGVGASQRQVSVTSMRSLALFPSSAAAGRARLLCIVFRLGWMTRVGW